MKEIICLLFIMPFSVGAYYSSYNSIQSDLDNIKRKQECLERQNREQREYSECLEECRQRERRNRQMASLTGSSYISSSCFCFQPSSFGCY